MNPEPPDLPDQIRSRCAEVAAVAQSVTIAEGRLPAYAELLAGTDALVDPTDPAHEPVGADDEARCLFVLALDAINFGSGWFPLLDKRPGHSGYHTVAAGLADHAASDGFAVGDLMDIDADRIAAILGQRPDGPVRPLMEDFARSLVLLGELLRGRADHSAAAFVASAEGSAAELAARLVAGHPMYRDAPEYRGRPVPLHKRAQITAADLHHAFGGQGPGRFDDLHRLTMFADNLVPHVLRLDGLLRFDDDLVDRIDGGDLLAPGEPAEVEIRAVAVHAVELLVDELRGTERPLSAMELDGLLWHRGGGGRYKARSRHRCRTVAY